MSSALTATKIEKTKPKAKPVKLADGRGLLLLIQPNGGKWWRFRYTFDGREKMISLGTYPEISLERARQRREEARRLVAEGTDPAEERRVERDARGNTFGLIAEEWYEKFRPSWADSHTRTVRGRLDLHLLPFLGKRAIRDLTAPDILRALRRVESSGAHETARRCLQIVSNVMRFAVATGRADRDPCPDLRGALAPVEVKHHAAITDPAGVAGLLRMIDGYPGTIVVRCALKLAPLTFVRPGELRKAEWTEVDLDRGMWIIPAWRMKMKQSLSVPLSRQAVAILRELHRVTGHGKFVFPSARSPQRPMSDVAVLAALRRMGIPSDEMSGHGVRALARTLLDEVLHYRVDLIEAQLGHAVKDPNGRAYNRTSFVKERTEMMQAWSDYLDTLKSSGPALAEAGA
jgi:integrase